MKLEIKRFQISEGFQAGDVMNLRFRRNELLPLNVELEFLNSLGFCCRDVAIRLADCRANHLIQDWVF